MLLGKLCKFPIFKRSLSINKFFTFCIIQGARHTFSEAVGKNVANPTAMLLASANMLNHVNLQYYGDMIQNAVDRVIRVGKVRK